MKVIFIVQGEGRGHLTQAISMWQLLKENGHTVAACLVGVNGDYGSFLDGKIDVPVTYFKSPTLAYGQHGTGLSIKRTLIQNTLKTPQFFKSVQLIRQKIRTIQPDLIINFYDLLGGITKAISPNIKVPMVGIAHQYLLLHKDFKFPKGKLLDRWLVNTNTRITALKAKKLMALAFESLTETNKIVSVAPLLRHEINTEKVSQQNYLLAYLTHPSPLPQLLKWHEQNPEKELHCFVQREQENNVEQIRPRLFLHKPDSQKFLHLMANCAGLVTTAGFESVSEAIFFGKPVMMIPVPNHFEQKCNAYDAAQYGAGIAAEEFDVNQLLAYLNEYKNQSSRFKNWLKEGSQILIKELESLALPNAV